MTPLRRHDFTWALTLPSERLHLGERLIGAPRAEANRLAVFHDEILRRTRRPHVPRDFSAIVECDDALVSVRSERTDRARTRRILLEGDHLHVLMREALAHAVERREILDR